jgi:uncharacterized protein
VAEFEIKLSELESGSREYDLPIRAAWLCEQLSDLACEDVPVASNDGTLQLTAETSGDDVLVRGHAHASITTVCGRCLGPAHFDADADIAVLMIRRGSDHRPVADEEELTPEEEDREFFSGDEVVLDDVIREHLVLELPMQPLCREDCPGIAIPESVRGPADLQATRPDAVLDANGKVVDPRLAPLLALANKAAVPAANSAPSSSRASSSEPRKKKSRR